MAHSNRFGTLDIGAIPRINSVVLTGLDFSMKPEATRYEVSQGWITPFPEIKVMHTIKSLAVMVYNQEKLTPFYHANVCDGRNSLAYFICAVHRQQAPQPETKTKSQSQTHSRQGSNASASSHSSASSCKSANPGKNCELPKLTTTTMLPLGHWDSLYYALVAEIRILHSDLQNRFGFGCENGTEPLHYNGPEGDSNQPITAIDLASMLETAWYTLMDNRLVAALDGAVQLRKLRDESAKADIENATKQFISSIKKDDNDVTDKANNDAYERPPIIHGLIDVNALTPEDIISILWQKHAHEINEACCEEFEDESMLTAYRAEIYKKNVEGIVAASTPLPSAVICKCHRTCLCKLKCDQSTGQCTCQNLRADVFDLVYSQSSLKDSTYKYVKRDQKVPNQFLGAATNTLAQMQIAALANPSPTVVQACYSIHDANEARERQVASRNRQRSNTNKSELAYVPEVKVRKDIYPLDFYGRNSGQRYPKLPSQAYSVSPSQLPDTSYDMPNANVPARKPVPPPIMPPTYVPPQYHGRYQGPTPPTSSPHNVTTFTQSGQVTYPAVPASQSHNMFTQSFPAPTTGNPRSNEDTQTDTQMNSNNGAEDYIDLLPHHPSAIEPYEQTTRSLPKVSRPTRTFSPARAATTAMLPTLQSLNALKEKPQPPLPEPDFIAPRPALKQRYVSAGGNARLQDRVEIQGPALSTPSGRVGTGVTKAELDAKMNDPEWVMKNFGVTGTISPPRPSVESSKRNSKHKSGGRSSDESDRAKDSEKRDRTSSGASRVAKLKRVFSRKNSQSETD